MWLPSCSTFYTHPCIIEIYPLILISAIYPLILALKVYIYLPQKSINLLNLTCVAVIASKTLLIYCVTAMSCSYIKMLWLWVCRINVATGT